MEDTVAEFEEVEGPEEGGGVDDAAIGEVGGVEVAEGVVDIPIYN